MLTKVKINTKSLIGLLNASPAVTNTLYGCHRNKPDSGGSYFLYDLDNENLIDHQLKPVTTLRFVV